MSLCPKSPALKALLLNRLSRFVPAEAHATIWPSWHARVGDHVIDTIPPRDPAAQGPVKEFMRNNFYKEAPIPRALQLGDGSPRVSEFLDKEMNMYMSSGASIVVRRASDPSQITGVAFLALWQKDESYEVIEADGLSWHNTAAEIAHEVDPEESRLVWRDYQFQHLYNICQKTMRESGRGIALWVGCLSYAPSARSSGVTDVIVGNAYERVKAFKGVVGTQSNFRAYDKVIYQSLNNPTLVDALKYGDEILTFRGARVFKVLENYGEIRFFTDLA